MVANRFNWTIILLVSFVGVAVFGFAGMAMDPEHSHRTCLAANVQGALPCPESGALAFLNFHLNAFRSFSLAVLVVLIISIIAALWFYENGAGEPLAISGLGGSTHRQLRHWDAPPSFLDKIISWFSLLENSPALS